MPREPEADERLFAEAAAVSRETRDRLAAYLALLKRWQTTTNLVAPRDLDILWTRHVADSLQIADLAGGATRFVDLGSGGGFPGLVLAVILAERGEGEVVMVESNARKCAFLRAAIRETGARARVLDGRIEQVAARLDPPEIVTARALAPLAELCALAHPLLREGGIGLFHKGREAREELTAARRSWRIEAETLPSRVDDQGCILRITQLGPLAGLTPPTSET